MYKYGMYIVKYCIVENRNRYNTQWHLNKNYIYWTSFIDLLVGELLHW